jgi:hypothetical protein
VLAHQGGWDEILIVVGPMVVIGALLAVARRRVSVVADDEAPAYPVADGVTDAVDQ